MNLFKGWSFSRKLMAVNAVYILPCAVLVYFLILDKSNQVEFSEKERLGIEYQRPLETLLGHVAQYKVAVLASLSGKNDGTEKAESLKSQIERDFAALDEVDSRTAEVLRFTPAALLAQKREKAAPQAIKSQWQSLTEQHDSLVFSTAGERFDKLISDIRLAISHVGDTSNLILDPDLDSYYLMDAVLLALPQGQDRLQETVSYLRSLAVNGEQAFTEEQKIRLNVLGTMLKADAERLTLSIQTALNEDKNFQGIQPSLQRDIPPALKDLTSIGETFIRSVFSIANSPVSLSSLETAMVAGDQAMDANLAFWTKSADELDKLLDTRVESIKRARTLALVLALLAWMPAVLIAAFTVRRLNRAFIDSVSKLESEASMANTSSAHLASTSQTVSSGSTEQAAAIQETGASMSEMASMVSRSSTQAVSSQELANKVREQTDEGCRVIERMVYSMEAIQESNAQLQNISNIISDISGKTNIINDIVGKTQLLSFNASIEAARAGQHGRGFAVVAEEVGNLAQTSGNAAKEIRNLIEDSRVQVEHILKSTVDRVVEGRTVTAQAQEIFLKIAKDIALISTQIESISEAAREQQFGIEQIAKAMTQMDETTQANNSAALTAARLSDQLMSQSNKLSLIAKGIAELVSGNIQTKRSGAITTKRKSSSDDAGDGHSHASGVLANHSSAEKIVANLTSKEHELDRPGHLAPANIDADDASFQKVI